MASILKDLKITKYTIQAKVPGASLQGIEYEPLFDYYSSMRETGCFIVYPGEFVTSESGTGMVHCAPFGEEDFGLLSMEL
jgi:isoleucyl-tRNA synthetase